MTGFKGFTKDAFAVYTPERWSSMVHNLPRMRNKDTMLALCSEAATGLEDALHSLSRAASDEIPNIMNHKKVDAQWVYWFRDETARAALSSFLEKTPLDSAVIFNIAPQDKHVTLAVILRHTELWIGLRLAAGASVDRRNLATKLGKSWEREHMLGLLVELPETAQMGFDDAPQAVRSFDLETLTQLGERLAEPNTPAFCLGVSLPADDVVALGPQVVDEVRSWLGVLAPLYRFAAWTRDNDLIDAGKQIQEEKAQKRRQATAFGPGDKVRITGGLFRGKLGVVQESDTKKQVKVLVGKVSVLIAGTDLVPAQ